MNKEYKDLETRYNSLVRASLKQNDHIMQMQNELKRLANDNNRLSAQLAVEKLNNQLLGDELNTRVAQSAKHIEDLRSRLKAHGLDAEVS
ncbi:MAG: hypothetical protein AMJ55_00385 [Gammaproteobacteria bacterium SG8_15]|nr:MAG: hypothetical protein AMJ55_00385 [Gammaproteobacteria bacterium SG8_15]